MHRRKSKNLPLPQKMRQVAPLLIEFFSSSTFTLYYSPRLANQTLVLQIQGRRTIASRELKTTRDKLLAITVPVTCSSFTTNHSAILLVD
ncbi:hypothetical protein IFVP408_C180076 [Vibrio parahaemolyticus]